MSEVVSALGGAVYDGYVRVADMGPQGMVTVKGDLNSATLCDAVSALTSLEIPQPRGSVSGPVHQLLWMAPDEIMVLLPYAGAVAAEAQLQAELAEMHALVVNVSDARAMISLTGEHVREVLAKLTPTDMEWEAFAAGEVRRTRLAQVPAAIMMVGEDEAYVLCFRSVARYVFDLLAMSARPGAEVGVRLG